MWVIAMKWQICHFVYQIMQYQNDSFNVDIHIVLYKDSKVVFFSFVVFYYDFSRSNTEET